MPLAEDRHRPATIVVDGAPYALAVHDAEEGGFWAEVAGLPGCLTQGDTLDELDVNAQDAIRCWLEGEQATALPAYWKRT